MTCRLSGARPRILVLVGVLALPSLAVAQPDPLANMGSPSGSGGTAFAPPGKSREEEISKAPVEWGCILFSPEPSLPFPPAVGDLSLPRFTPRKGTGDGTAKDLDFGIDELLRNTFVFALRRNDGEANGVPAPLLSAGLELPPAPPSLRAARVPVPALYRLGVTARLKLAGSLLFAIHPLLALTPTADFLDAPSDHPQPVAGEDVLGSMPPENPSVRVVTGFFGECVRFHFAGPTWYDWLVGHFVKRHVPAEPEPEVELAHFRVEEDAAEPAEPAGEQLEVMPKEEKPAAKEATCPYLLQQAADRHVRLMADPEVTQDVLSNIRSLEEADRLFELAGELLREGHVGEAMTCYEVIRRLVPGSRFETQIDEVLAEFGLGVPPEATDEPEPPPQTKKACKKDYGACLKQILACFQAIGVPMPPLVPVSSSHARADSGQRGEDSEDARQIECEWERRWFSEQPPTPGRVEAASVESASSADENEAVENRLRRPISIHLDDMPLRTVLKDLRAFHGIRIRLDRKAIEEEGIDLEQPVSVFLEDVSLRSALHLMLHPRNLTFVVKDDAVWIIPRTRTKKAEAVKQTGASSGPCKKESPSQREREILKQLKTPVTVNFADASLKTVIEDLRAWKGMNIFVDEAALAEHGISLDRPVTMRLNDVSLESALKLLLRPLHLTHVIKDEVLVITTEDLARGEEVMTTYNVSDLVVKKPRTTCSAEPSEEETLMRLITSTIAPQSWAAKGGSGTVDYFPLTQSLVIRQTPDVQEQVADLLAVLRLQLENEKAGVAEQVAGLLKACRLAAEAGETDHAADLARQAFALDPESVSADPLVYKMHLLSAAPKTGGCPAPRCEPRTDLDCPRVPEAPEVLPPPTEEAEPPPSPDGGTLLNFLLAPHGCGELGLDPLDGSVRAACNVHCGGKVYNVRLRHGSLELWTTPDTSGSPEP